MIKIINISDDLAPVFGVNRYKLMINDALICEFDHDRIPNGLADCLRDAAAAVDAMRRKEALALYNKVQGITLDDCEPKMDDA